MGCSTSKLDDEEVVQLCKDRKSFIKEAVEQRIRFACGHTAYVQSLKRVAAALRNYVEGDEPREFFLDSFTTPPFTPVKKTSPGGLISITPKSFSTPPSQPQTNSSFKVNYLRSGGNPAVHVEERPPSPENVRIESYSPMHQYGIDGFFAMQSSHMNSSSFFSLSPNHRASFPPPSPPNSQWDFFWNPFASLDTYGYPTRSSIDQTIMDDDVVGLRQVREEEGIPDLEEDRTEEEEENKVEMKDTRTKVDLNFAGEKVTVEDHTETDSESGSECECETDTEHDIKGLHSNGTHSVEASETQNVGIQKQETSVVGDQESKEETPGFTVYVNRRPTSMAEVIKDIETQFMIVCSSANEVAAMLEASRAQYSSTTNELSAAKMLNPVALFRSASSRSSSSRFFPTSSSRDEGCDSGSDFSEESCMFSGSHQSTLDRLYAWEKKLYVEVKSGERIRIAYEKKCNQLRSQDVKGDDPSAVDKTRAAIRDLHTQIKVSIHSVEAVSKRIEALRDDELQPQLLELIQGLARMWKVMAECHQFQKRTVDEAKLLLAGTPPKLTARKQNHFLHTDPNRLAQSAANLESELRNWRTCFEAWIIAQRSYMHALTGWLLRCMQCDSDTSKLPFSPRRSSGAPSIFGICIQWSRFLDAVHEIPVIDGIDFFAAGMGSLYANQLREDSRRTPTGSKRFGAGTPTGSKRFGAGFSPNPGKNMEMVAVGEVEEVMTAEKTAEVAVRVLCAGMSMAISSLTEFAISSAEGYADLVKQSESSTKAHGTPRVGL